MIARVVNLTSRSRRTGPLDDIPAPAASHPAEVRPDSSGHLAERRPWHGISTPSKCPFMHGGEARPAPPSPAMALRASLLQRQAPRTVHGRVRFRPSSRAMPAGFPGSSSGLRAERMTGRLRIRTMQSVPPAGLDYSIVLPPFDGRKPDWGIGDAAHCRSVQPETWC